MREIKISEIQIIPVKPKNGLVAFASCVINNQFYIGDIAIHNLLSKPGCYRLVYPAKVLVNGKRMNCVYPINRHTAASVENLIVDEYKKLIEKVVKNENKNYSST